MAGMPIMSHCQPYADYLALWLSAAVFRLRRLVAFNLCNLGLFGIELKPGVGINFTVE